ncbi:hypothetical protein DSCO28_07590 [Desulfosarcina ovata subsp. sediminis]|uniref:Uncharacterized protein n=1 Tax=Desulfosarcina ovata subsp. sediminis TaxID=885957 RepID=A0A5K7ZQY7_9BACT|nr:hypothetical protein DSCO28_07590 [Desulfosarcina ovata subsp. sediminis]
MKLMIKKGDAGLCEDCIHFGNTLNGWTQNQCKITVDPVHGDTVAAINARSDDGPCGPQGKFFQPKLIADSEGAVEENADKDACPYCGDHNSVGIGASSERPRTIACQSCNLVRVASK